VRRAYFLTQHIQVSVPRHTPCFTTVTVTRWALVSYLFSLLTLETFDSAVMFAGGLAAALMEEAKTWLVHGGALAVVLLLFELAADTTYFLLSRSFVHTTLTFSSTLLSFMRAHLISLAWELVVGAVVIDSGLAHTFDTRLPFCA